jgi:hypothetical protein
VRIVASTLLGYIINRLIIDAERQWDDATEVEVMASVLADGIMGALACRK